MQLKPFRDYTGIEHVLGAAPTFVHPITRNLYFCACEKRNSLGQDFVVYRMVPGVPDMREVKRYVGGVDAVSQFTMGGAVIDTYGALLTATSCVPKNAPNVTKTGFQAVWDWIPDIDEPWLGGDIGALEQQIAGLQAENQALWDRIAALEAQSGDSLSAEDRASLDWTAQVRALE